MSVNIKKYVSRKELSENLGISKYDARKIKPDKFKTGSFGFSKQPRFDLGKQIEIKRIQDKKGGMATGSQLRKLGYKGGDLKRVGPDKKGPFNKPLYNIENLDNRIKEAGKGGEERA